MAPPLPIEQLRKLDNLLFLPRPGLHKAHAAGLGGAAVGSTLFGVPPRASSKNREEGGVLTLGGCC